VQQEIQVCNPPFKIETDTRDFAFKVFNVTNARGLALTSADLLKSSNLGVIKGNDNKIYTDKWEDIEKELDIMYEDSSGNEEINKLIGYIRDFKMKESASEVLHKEIEKIFDDNPDFKGKKFIDYLENLFNVYEDRINEKNIRVNDEQKKLYYRNLLSILENYYPSLTITTSFNRKLPNA
jgi:hypothetical protein